MTEFRPSRTGLDRGFLYITKSYRDLIPLNSNNKVNVIIDDKTSEHTFDKYGRLFGLKKWFISQKINSNTPILIKVKENGIELKLNYVYDDAIEKKLKALALEILDLLYDDGDKMSYSVIEDLWDTFNNSKDLTLSQFEYYMSRVRKMKKNWRVSVKSVEDGVMMKKKTLMTIENGIILVLTIFSGLIGGIISSLLG